MRRALILVMAGAWLAGASPAAAGIVEVPSSPFPVYPSGIAFSPSGRLLAAGLGSGIAVLSVDPATNGLTPVTGSPFATSTGEQALAFSPDGTLLATANANGNVDVLSVSASGSLTPVTTLAANYASAVAFSRDGKLIAATNAYDGTVSVYARSGTSGAWGPVAGSPFSSSIAPDSSGGPTLGRLVFSPGGGLLAVSTDRQGNTPAQVALLTVNQSTGALTPSPGSPFSTGAIQGARGAAFTPDGNFLATGSPDVGVFSVAPSGALSPDPGSPYPSGASVFDAIAYQNYSVAYSPDGRLLVAGTPAGIGVAAVDGSTGVLSRVAGSPFSFAVDQITDVAISPTGRLIAIGGSSSGLRLFAVTPTMQPGDPTASEGASSPVVLARDNCAVPGAPATVNWGDGSPAETVGVRSNGDVAASPAQLEEGTYHGSVTMSDPCGATGVTFTTTIADAPLSASAAALTATAGVDLHGQVATFTDADPGALSTDYSATIDWGDGQTSSGTVQPGSGAAFTIVGDHTYARHGSYPVRVSVVDSGGSASVGQATAVVAVNPLPPPELGKKVNVFPDAGTVLVQPRKGEGFVELVEPRQLPVGAQIDARGGAVTLVTATTRNHVTQTGQFSGGRFSVDQSRSLVQKGLATLTLVGSDFASCSRNRAADDWLRPVAQMALSHSVLQTLKAHDNHGRFRTRGRYAAATVRGTSWDMTDRCDGTLTTVRQGTVAVYDFISRKTVSVHAGQRYLAKAP